MSVTGFARSPEGKIIICALVVAPFLLTPWVHGDGIAYFACLRSLIIDRNLDLTNEFQYLSTHVSADAGGLPGYLLARSDYAPGIDPNFHTPKPDPVTGRVPSYFSIGPAIAWAPAYLIAHVGVRLARYVGLSHRDDGYGGAYYVAIALTSLFCGIAGLVLAFRLSQLVAPPREAFWAALTIGAASALLYYLYLAPSYPHALSTLTAGAFFLYWLRSRHAPSAGTWFWWGFLAGLLFLVRWNDIVLAVPVLGVEAVRVLRGKVSFRGRGSTRSLVVCLAVALLGFFLVSWPQFAVWQYFHGRPWVRYPFPFLGFNPEAFWSTLVSARHGLFTWTPVTLLALAGLFRLFRRNRELAGITLVSFGLLVLSNCFVSDWWGGASFGMRRLISATPLLVLGLAVMLDDIRKTLSKLVWGVSVHARIVAPVVFVVFSIWNVLLMAQYSLGMISHTEPVSLVTIAANQPKVVIRMVRLVGEILR